MQTATHPAEGNVLKRMDLQRVLDSLEATPALLKAMTENLNDEQLRSKPGNDVFSLVENICHLRDLEREAYAERIRRILAEDNPLLADFDGGQIAAERNYNAENLSDALDAFSLARRENVDRIKGCDPEALKREGILEGVGAIRLEQLLRMMNDHDSDHLTQMSELAKS